MTTQTPFTLLELQNKLYLRKSRDYWEVWLWDEDNRWQSKRGGWATLEIDDSSETRFYNKAAALEGLALAHVAHGPDANLRLMHWAVQKDTDVTWFEDGNDA